MDSVLLHDVKNVEQRLSLLLSNLEEHYGDPEFKRSVVDLLMSTVAKLDAIAGRFTAGRDAVLIKVPVDLNDLLLEVTRRVRPRAGSGARVVSELGELLPVWGDTYYLTDAFSSLFENALEAAGEAGTVRVRTSILRRKGKSRVVAEVEDDGPGMSEEFLRDRLFRPFQTTKACGVGLGLYTARQILQLHGGDLEVESRPGAGTLVRAMLPVSFQNGKR